MNKYKNIPLFKSEEEEREFWSLHDSSEYIDWEKAKRPVFPNLRPSSKTISLRLPEHILNEIKMIARKRDIPYQSLIKMFLSDRLKEELGHPK